MDELLNCCMVAFAIILGEIRCVAKQGLTYCIATRSTWHLDGCHELRDFLLSKSTLLTLCLLKVLQHLLYGVHFYRGTVGTPVIILCIGGGLILDLLLNTLYYRR